MSRDFAEIFRPMRIVYLKCEFHGDLFDLLNRNQLRLFLKCLDPKAKKYLSLKKKVSDKFGVRSN